MKGIYEKDIYFAEEELKIEQFRKEIFLLFK
jgi:hypothetical protein